MTAIQSLLAGLFDYAGLYPPAALSLRSAVNSYLDYARDRHSSALGRFIINADRIDELRSTVGDRLQEIKLSVIVSESNSLDAISNAMKDGLAIEALEIKSVQLEAMERIAAEIPQSLITYVEVPFDSRFLDSLEVISRLGMRAKIRMGGVVAEAFPPVSQVVSMLKTFVMLRIPFKATAGLHHPIRSTQSLTYEPQSQKETMHGFINLCCAAAVLKFGGEEKDAEGVLREEDRSAWAFAPDALQWRHLKWTRDQLSLLRREFFISIGSCSFEEPIRDLEALGWL